MKTITITDTGLNTVGGSVEFTQANSGSAVSLQASTFRGEFGTRSQEQDTLRGDTSNTFNNPLITAATVPRFTIQGHIVSDDVSDTVEVNSLITNLIELNRSKGIKKIEGGMAMTASVPESVDASVSYIYAIIKNITFTESSLDTNTLLKFTIQLEQVQ